MGRGAGYKYVIKRGIEGVKVSLHGRSETRYIRHRASVMSYSAYILQRIPTFAVW